MSDTSDTYVAFDIVPHPETWEDYPGQFIHDGKFFRKVRLVSPPHPTECRLRATLYAAKGDEPLPAEDRNAVIHAMIDQFDGVQDHALGTVVIPVPLDGLDPEIVAQLWIHEWE
jgi:hypothetical protein